MTSSITLARRLDNFGAETVWQEFTPLAAASGAINLGQGFPNWESPAFVKAAIKRAVDENHNQYCRSAGHAPLCQAIAKRYSAHLARDVNWETEVAIGVGSSECLYAISQAFLDPGDEAILISPAFDIYSAQVEMAGAKAVYVPLRLVPDEANPGKQVWRLDFAELRAAFTERTKLIIVNSPQNPTGKAYTAAEYEQFAAILRDYPRVLAVCDEVYEWMLYGSRSHVRLASLLGMYERCLTVSSAGKTFSVTGWKIGWVVGPAELVKGVVLTNQWVQFSVSTPAQQAIAYALEEADKPYEGHANYYAWLRASYEAKRALLMDGLAAAGLEPVAPEGGFFIIADTRAVQVPESYLSETTKAAPIMRRDWAFCRFLTQEIKVAAIPPSAFFAEPDKDLAANMARFAFCKEDDSLVEACRRLQGLRAFIKPATEAGAVAGGAGGSS